MPKKNKPRWKNLNMYERLARRHKQNGGSEYMVNWLHEKAREKEQKQKEIDTYRTISGPYYMMVDTMSMMDW